MFDYSPIGRLSGVLLDLRAPATIVALSGRLVGLLELSEADAEILLGEKTGMSDKIVESLSLSEARVIFRRRLQDRLYRSEPLVRSRMKLVLARFCAVSFLYITSSQRKLL